MIEVYQFYQRSPAPLGPPERKKQSERLMPRKTPVRTYKLKKPVYYHTGFYQGGLRGLCFWLKEGEHCQYFAKDDTYLFKARSGMVPFISRQNVESSEGEQLFEAVTE